MALISCPECGNQVSTFAAACPKCGCPIEPAQAAPAAQPAQVAQPAPAAQPVHAASAPQPAPAQPAPQASADCAVFEFPGPSPDGTLSPVYMNIGKEKHLVEWGKTVSVKVTEATNGSLPCSISPFPWIVALVVGVVLSIVYQNEVGVYNDFFVSMLLLFGPVLLITPLYNYHRFAVMPGRRYKLYWEKKLFGYTLKTQEIPD